MAKNKKVLTPEELEAKRARKAEKGKIFGETFIKALAVMLSVVLVYSIVYIAFGQGTTIEQRIVTSSGNGGSTSNNGGSTNNGGSGNNGTSTDNNGSTDNANSAPASDEAADAVAAINAATAKAASAGYDWARKCVIEKVDVGNATSALDRIIHMVDKNASIESVVGNFLGRGDKSETIAKGENAEEKTGNKGYSLKATTLKAEDLQNLQVNGNTYTFTLPEAKNPQKDGSTPLARLTNDFITQDEVSKGIADALGSLSSMLSVKSADVVFKDIKVTIVIEDGSLKEFSYSYYMDVQKLELSVATGTGYGTIEGSYKNFQY